MTGSAVYNRKQIIEKAHSIDYKKGILNPSRSNKSFLLRGVNPKNS